MAVVGSTGLGVNLVFGVTTDVLSLVTQKVSSNLKSDRKEARDKTGKVIAASYYNMMNDISVDFLGKADTSTNKPGVAVVLGMGYSLVGAGYIDEVSHDQDNQDFEGGTIKATAWEGIPVGG